MYAKKCHVLIRRSIAETIGKCVYEHEIPILKEIFGPGNVTLDESKKNVIYRVENINHDEEYNRLEYVYGMHEEIKMTNCRVVYNAMDDARMEEKGEKLYAGEPAMVPPDESDTGGNAIGEDDINEALVALPERTLPEIKKFFDSIGFAYSAKATKGALLESYNDHLRVLSEEAQKRVENPELDD